MHVCNLRNPQKYMHACSRYSHTWRCICGDDHMSVSESKLKANKKYREKFVYLQIRLTAEERSKIQAHAEVMNESVNTFVHRAIALTMEQDLCDKEWMFDACVTEFRSRTGALRLVQNTENELNRSSVTSEMRSRFSFLPQKCSPQCSVICAAGSI